MGPGEHQVIAEMLRLLHDARSDPLRAQVLLGQVEALANKLHGMHEGTEIGRWRTLRVPNLPQLAVAPGAGSISNTGQARWPQRCLVVAAYGAVLSDPPLTGTGASSVAFQILAEGGDKSLIIDGRSADFMLFLAAFGVAQNWYPIGMIAEGPDSTWGVGFKNFSTGSPFTPEFYFRFIPLPPAKGK
jgi:hypothetical protein